MESTHPFGNLAAFRLTVEGPWLCVPASRRVCPFEDEEVNNTHCSVAAGAKALLRATHSGLQWNPRSEAEPSQMPTEFFTLITALRVECYL